MAQNPVVIVNTGEPETPPQTTGEPASSQTSNEQEQLNLLNLGAVLESNRQLRESNQTSLQRIEGLEARLTTQEQNSNGLNERIDRLISGLEAESEEEELEELEEVQVEEEQALEEEPPPKRERRAWHRALFG